MSKRRINKQQQARIDKNQKNFQDVQDNTFDGLVISRFGRHVEIENTQGNRLLCSIRPNLSTLVAGDRIIWQPEGQDQGVVVSLYPRSSVLARPTSRGLKKPVAANISQMIVVVAPKPLISWPLLDSYLIMAEILNLHAVILLNKTDIPCDDLKTHLFDYQTLNYPVLFINKKEPELFEPLKKILNNEISVFIGQSGVGKSSLIAGILPHEQDIAINDISLIAELGRHTTSNSRYYHLPSGGALIDSPGVREFSLWDVDATTIAQGYVEFRPYLSLCKFRNCTHIQTPFCALIAAVDQGIVSSRRYNNFVKLCIQFCSS